MIKKRLLFVFIYILIPLVLFLIGWIYYSIKYVCYITPDEGTQLALILRLLHGQIMYKDFHNVFLPAAPYLYTWLFKLTNIDLLLLERLLDNLLASLSAILIYFISKRMMPFMVSLFLGLQLIFMTGAGYPYSVAFPSNFSIFFCLLGLLMVYRFFETNKYIYIYGSGIAMALAASFFQVTGASVTIATIGFIYLKQRIKHKYSLKEYLWFTAGMSSVILPITVYFYLNSCLSNVVKDVIGWGLTSHWKQLSKTELYPNLLKTPGLIKFQLNTAYFFLFLKQNPLFFPIVISLYSIGYIGYRFLTKKVIKQDFYFFPLFIFTLISLPYTTTSFIGSQWAVVAPIAHMVGAYLIVLGFKYTIKNIFKKSINSFLVIIILMPLLIYYVGPINEKAMRYEKSVFAGVKTVIPCINKYRQYIIPQWILPTIRYSGNTREYLAAEYIKNNSHPRDKIFIFGHGTEIYYLSNRVSATKDVTGALTIFLEEGGEEEFINDLERGATKYVIMIPSTWLSITKDKYGKIFDYIEKEYFQIKEISGYQIYFSLRQ